MKRNITSISVIASLALITATPFLSSYSTVPPTGLTGSPADGSDCTTCHSSFTSEALEAVISTDIPQEGYIAGETYNITVSGMEETGFVRYGFSLTAETLAGSKVGTFTAGTNSVVSGNHIGHNPAITSSSPSWTFTWTAPSNGTGNVTFYGAFVQANGQSGNLGDKVKTSSVTFNENTGTSLQTISENEFDIYSSGNTLYLKNKGEAVVNQILIYNNMGQVVLKTTEITSSIKINQLNEGVYFVTLETNKGYSSHKIFK